MKKKITPIYDHASYQLKGDTFKKRQTAGELSLKAAQDESKYDSLEIGHDLTNDVAKELMECVRRHNPIFDEEKYFVGYVLAGDPLLKNILRRKFFAMLYMPSPRPNQAVFLYNKRFDRFEKRLWVLPNAATMAELSEMPSVAPQYKTMKEWSDAFFDGSFWTLIRKQSGNDLVSEIEYLKLNRDKLVKAGCKEIQTPLANPFDFSKIAINKIVDTKTAIPNK